MDGHLAAPPPLINQPRNFGWPFIKGRPWKVRARSLGQLRPTLLPFMDELHVAFHHQLSHCMVCLQRWPSMAILALVASKLWNPSTILNPPTHTWVLPCLVATRPRRIPAEGISSFRSSDLSRLASEALPTWACPITFDHRRNGKKRIFVNGVCVIRAYPHRFDL